MWNGVEIGRFLCFLPKAEKGYAIKTDWAVASTTEELGGQAKIQNSQLPSASS